jgi:2,4-dienoyl-CoA reductase-like NADH-dependent reductase (Old Yellow Enzyme family)
MPPTVPVITAREELPACHEPGPGKDRCHTTEQPSNGPTLHPVVTDTSQLVDGLFEPFEVKSLHLRNRFAMAPMTRMFSPDGIPTVDVAEYYRRRAAGGVGLIITEGTYIPDPAAGPHTSVPRHYGEQSLAGWKAVVDAVHAEGGQIIPQLWHLGVGRGDKPELNPEIESVSPSGFGLDGTASGRD